MPRRPKNLNELTRWLAYIVGATEAAVFGVTRDKFGEDLRTLIHIRGGSADANTLDAARRAFKDIVGRCIRASQDGAIQIIDNEQGKSSTQFCLVKLAKRKETTVGVAAFIVRCGGQEEANKALDRIRTASFSI